MSNHKNIPPTSSASQYHSLRVYHQVQVWKGQKDEDLCPSEYGWKVVDGKLCPVLTDIDPAPQSLLQVVHCCCKTGCQSIRCTCRKHGMECTMACSECRGVCSNVTPCLEQDSDDELGGE